MHIDNKMSAADLFCTETEVRWSKKGIIQIIIQTVMQQEMSAWCNCHPVHDRLLPIRLKAGFSWYIKCLMFFFGWYNLLSSNLGFHKKTDGGNMLILHMNVELYGPVFL